MHQSKFIVIHTQTLLTHIIYLFIYACRLRAYDTIRVDVELWSREAVELGHWDSGTEDSILFYCLALPSWLVIVTDPAESSLTAEAAFYGADFGTREGDGGGSKEIWILERWKTTDGVLGIWIWTPPKRPTD